MRRKTRRSRRRRPPPAPPCGSRAAGRRAATGERRQLTVMFCDLVGSTALSTQLDPEDLRDVIAAYHKCAPRGGRPLRRLRRQIYGRRRAGLFRLSGGARGRRRECGARRRWRWSRRSRSLFADGRHQVRIGIATGLVVVGELVGGGEAQERNVVGETPNLAARLQSAAAPEYGDDCRNTRRLPATVRIGNHRARRRSRASTSRSAPGACCASERIASRFERCARQTTRRWSAATRKSICCSAAGSRPRPARAASCCSPASPASANRA